MTQIKTRILDEPTQAQSFPHAPTADVPRSNVWDALQYLSALISGASSALANHISDATAAHAASAIAFTPAGNLSADDVQEALQELDTEKAATNHTHTASAITDFNEAAQDAVGGILSDAGDIDFTYNDAGGSISATIKADAVGPTELENTAVSPGSYTSANITVDAQGRVTAAANGSGSGDVTAASAFSNDNRLIRSDGTGKGVQASGVTVDDSNNVSGIAALGTTTIELGHASDTTLSRSSAGVLAVEGVTVPLNSTTSVHTAQQIELGHASDTTISRTGAGAIAVEGNGVALNTTSQVHTCSSLEVGNASDTTISRSAAGVIAVEGVPVYPQIPQTSLSAATTLDATHANRHILHPAADNNARTFTIPANASVAYPIGTVIVFVNKINVVTIAITSDTLTWAPSGGTGSRSLAANSIATALKIASTEWIISGVGLT